MEGKVVAKKVTKKKEWEFDAAGWAFWVILFLVLIGPCIYLGKIVCYDDTSPTVWVGFGIVFSAIGAGLISWAVNSVVQRRRKRQRIVERKKAKRQQR
jgi:hypothetical protein